MRSTASSCLPDQPGGRDEIGAERGEPLRLHRPCRYRRRRKAPRRSLPTRRLARHTDRCRRYRLGSEARSRRNRRRARRACIASWRIRPQPTPMLASVPSSARAVRYSSTSAGRCTPSVPSRIGKLGITVERTSSVGAPAPGRSAGRHVVRRLRFRHHLAKRTPHPLAASAWVSWASSFGVGSPGSCK